jgi:hypothetical protein
MIVRPSIQSDIEYLRQNPMEEALTKYPQLKICDQNTYTAEVDGEVMVLGGIITLWSGVGEGWVILSKNCNKTPVLIYSCIKNVFKQLIKAGEFWRIQAIVRTDFPQSIKMIEHLGFKREGLLEKYCPDKCDAYMYARII